jgi:hypothetical protein
VAAARRRGFDPRPREGGGEERELRDGGAGDERVVEAAVQQRRHQGAAQHQLVGRLGAAGAVPDPDDDRQEDGRAADDAGVHGEAEVLVVRGAAAQQLDGRILRVDDQLARPEPEAEQRPLLDGVQEVGPDDVAAREVLAFPGEALERVEQRRAEQQQRRHHAAHQQVHLAPERKDARPRERQDQEQEQGHGDEGRPRLGAQHDGEVQPPEQQPAEAEAAQVFERGREDGGDAESGQERRGMQAVEATAQVQDRVESDQVGDEAGDRAHRRDQRHASAKRRPEPVRREGEAQDEGRGRADEAPRHVAVARDPPDGEDHDAEAGDRNEDQERPVDGVVDSVPQHQETRHGEGHHLDDRRAERRRRPAGRRH